MKIQTIEHEFDKIINEVSVEELCDDKYYLAEVEDIDGYDYYFIKIVQTTPGYVYSRGYYYKLIDQWVYDEHGTHINEMIKDYMNFIKFYTF